jgi:hypothetical protein
VRVNERRPMGTTVFRRIFGIGRIICKTNPIKEIIEPKIGKINPTNRPKTVRMN